MKPYEGKEVKLHVFSIRTLNRVSFRFQLNIHWIRASVDPTDVLNMAEYKKFQCSNCKSNPSYSISKLSLYTQF
jgi:hypothetical protein